MKKLIISLTCVFAFGTTSSNGNSINPKDNNLDISLAESVFETNVEEAVYVLIPTQNMWTFIKLNTRNGKMWQVQYDVQGNNRFETYLNRASLVLEAEEVNGRFKLYPTQNSYNFILIDQIDGSMWQVQWSIEAEDRFILPIN